MESKGWIFLFDLFFVLLKPLNVVALSCHPMFLLLENLYGLYLMVHLSKSVTPGWDWGGDEPGPCRWKRHQNALKLWYPHISPNPKGPEIKGVEGGLHKAQLVGYNCHPGQVSYWRICKRLTSLERRACVLLIFVTQQPTKYHPWVGVQLVYIPL